MRRYGLAVILLLAPLAFAQTQARFSTFEFEPPQPDSATNVQLHVVRTENDGCVPNTYSIVREGSTITVVFDPLPENTGCILIPVAWGKRIDLGMLAPGTYTVHVKWPNVFDESRQLVVSNAWQPVTVDPPVSPTAGGATITICCTEPKSITFDGLPATFEHISSSYVRVTTPPHAAGPAEIKITRTPDDKVITYTAFRYYDPNAAPDLSTFAKVLFPTFYNGPGAGASQWRSSGWIHYPFGPLGAWRQVTTAANPGTPAPLDASMSRPAGFFYFPARRQISNTSYELRVTDVSRQQQDAGTEIPVVFESNTRRRITLLGIQADRNARVLLRVYDWDGNVNPVVATIDFIGTTVSATIPITLANTCTSTPCDTPSYAAIDLTPSLASVLAGQPNDATFNARVTVEPRGNPGDPAGDARLWAFATITNNTTQHVTIVTPQREDKHVRGDE